MRGRKPKPTWLKIIQGKPGHRPLNVNEPIPEELIGPAPEDFTPEQRAVWDHAVKAAPLGLLTELDRRCLITYCVAAALYDEARKKIAQFGALVKTPITGVPMQSPWLSILNKQNLLMQRAIAEMGFSPTSRGRVKIERGVKDTGGGGFDDLKEITD
jgi:P27 family predicted phage terminase small subunit